MSAGAGGLTARFPRVGIVLLTLATISGCSGGGVEVNGVVRFADGEPVRSGRIEIRHAESRRRGMGTIDEEGRFRLAEMDGGHRFDPGEYDAIVVQMIVTEDLAFEDHGHGRMVPRRFADYDTSGLAVTVDDDPAQPIELVIGSTGAGRP